MSILEIIKQKNTIGIPYGMKIYMEFNFMVLRLVAELQN